MLADLATAVHDWRYPCGVLLLGAFLGHVFYVGTPPPKAARPYLERFIKAGAFSHLGGRIGSREMQQVAGAIGMDSMIRMKMAFRRQRRRMLVMGLLLAAFLLLPVFAFVILTWAPAWAFVLVGVVGGLWAWSLW